MTALQTWLGTSSTWLPSVGRAPGQSTVEWCSESATTRASGCVEDAAVAAGPGGPVGAEGLAARVGDDPAACVGDHRGDDGERHLVEADGAELHLLRVAEDVDAGTQSR